MPVQMPDVPDLSLAEELRKRGIHPNRRLGQNFMVDRQMLDFLVRTADVGKSDTVLEIGTGAGFLTQRLCQLAKKVVSVEIDAKLYELSRDRLSGLANLTLIHADALAGEHTYDDRLVTMLFSSAPPQTGAETVAQTVRKHTENHATNMRRPPDRRTVAHGQMLKIVSNLPYGIATAVIQTTLESDLPFSGIWATAQREVAERLTAKPGDSEYGFVSVLVSLLADIRIVRTLGPGVFWPRPNVESAIVEIILRPEKRKAAGDIRRLRRVLSKLFSFRRKELGAALKLSGLAPEDIIGVEARLCEMGVSTKQRVWKLTPEMFVEIAGAVRQTSRKTGS